MVKLSRVGGVIAAASPKNALPLLQIGTISVIRRIVISFQQAGIFPIVVVTGAEEDEVKYQLSQYGVIFIQDENCEHSELFDSVKIGLHYLYGKCDKVIFTPVNAPMFMPETLVQLMHVDGDIVVPSYRRHSGHPILMSKKIIPAILEFSGEGGMRAAIASMSENRIFAEVDDPGILMNIHDEAQLNERLREHSRALLHPVVKLSLQKEVSFFNTRTKLLLYLIQDTCSVRKACDRMALSYGKAWDMLNGLEAEIGYRVVERRHGGKQGGNTTLTTRGLEFLMTWQQFEDNIFSHTQSEFKALFSNRHIL